MTNTDSPETSEKIIDDEPKQSSKNPLIYVGVIFIGLLLLAGTYFGYLFISSPSHIRYPEYAHYHFRTQLLVNGELVDFAGENFQQSYDSLSCSAELPNQPIDFHDNAAQMTHIHWQGMTGGEFLKYYGWNFIGGNDNILGRRYDIGNLAQPVDVNIYGKSLPTLPDNANYYVYVGDENSYETRSWDTFINTDFEVLFSDSSSLEGNQARESAPLDFLFTRADAHGGANDGDGAINPDETEEQRLERINSLVGNVVIFVQEEEPTIAQIKDRFNNLAPLEDSVCGG